MSLELLIEDGIVLRRAALLADGRAVEFHLLRHPQYNLPQPGDIYGARVEKVFDETQTALLDLSGGMQALINFRHMPKKKKPVEGARFIIKIRRAAMNEKVENKLALATAKLSAEESAIVYKPGLLRSVDPLSELIAHVRNLRVDRLIVDTAALQAEISATFADMTFTLVGNKADLFGDAGLEEELDAIAAGIIPFQGGQLIIETTAAATVIDVNARTATQATNLAAVQEVARQLRLQNIGGLILVDFIECGNSKQREAIERVFDAAMADDIVEWQRGRLSSFSTLEITRERRGAALMEQLSKTLPRKKRREIACHHLLRCAERLAAHSRPGTLVLTIGPNMAGFLLNHQSYLDALTRRTGRKLRIVERSGSEDVHIDGQG